MKNYDDVSIPYLITFFIASFITDLMLPLAFTLLISFISSNLFGFDLQGMLKFITYMILFVSNFILVKTKNGN